MTERTTTTEATEATAGDWPATTFAHRVRAEADHLAFLDAQITRRYHVPTVAPVYGPPTVPGLGWATEAVATEYGCEGDGPEGLPMFGLVSVLPDGMPEGAGPFSDWASPGSRWDAVDGYVPGEATEWTEPRERVGEAVTWCRACGMVPGAVARSRRERATWAECDHDDLTAHRLPTGSDVGTTTLAPGHVDRDAVTEATVRDWAVPVPYVGATTVGTGHYRTTTTTTRGVHNVKRYRVRATGKGAAPVPNGLTTFAHPDYEATTVARQAIGAGRWPTRSNASRVATPGKGAVRVGHVVAPDGWHGPARYVPTTVARTWTEPVAHVTTTTDPGASVTCHGPSRDREATWIEHRPAVTRTAVVVTREARTTEAEAVPTWEATLRTKTGAEDKRRTGGRQGGKGRARRTGRESARVPAVVDAAALARAIAEATARTA